MNIEIWKPIPLGAFLSCGKEIVLDLTESGYVASNLGVVKGFGRTWGLNITRTTNRYTSPTINGKGRHLHRLVCWAWHGPPVPPRIEVNHKNAIKSDNRPENIEWCSHTENVQHAWREGLVNINEFKQRWAKQGKAVVQLDPLTKQPIATFPSIAEATRAFNGPSEIAIQDAVRTGRWLAFGFLWRHADGVSRTTAPMTSNTDKRCRPVVFSRNGTQTVYPSMIAASIATGLAKSTLAYAIGKPAIRKDWTIHYEHAPGFSAPTYRRGRPLADRMSGNVHEHPV